jgi:cellulose synthase/poly-beta-1,6-N-acetylglucosamine synthase-like glycosyltransferase
VEEKNQAQTSPAKISIIIPLHVCSERFIKDFAHFRSLEYPDFEVLIVADEPNIDENKNQCAAELKRLEKPGLVTILSTGKELTGPSEKRDLALEQASGEICAFIDDDAYPRPDWLRSAIKHFDDPQIAAVGGPGITPPEDNLQAQASGAVYASPLGSGQALHRFVPRRSREVDDFPAYNLFVRTEKLREVGGFASGYYGGEDTKLCLEIVKTGGKILYHPDIVVFHHRRPLFFGHLRQIANVGVHRGYFVKTYPETSWRLFYFLPSILVMVIFFGIILSLFSNILAAILVLSLAGYFAVALVSTMPTSRLSVALLGAAGIIMTHTIYGCAFIRGLLIKHLDE